MRILVTGGSGFIGTNLVARLLECGDTVLNLSNSAPLNIEHRTVWTSGDIQNIEEVRSSFSEFQPEIIVHLAARADCDETTTVESGYQSNTIGTANILTVIKETASVKRVIITSSQYVCGPGRLPKHDEDYFPHTIYGQSKVVTEQLTRRAGLSCCWTIIRPTNIWGPWHMRYAQEFWKIAAKNLYFHPAGPPVIRSYGYVETVIDQIFRILEMPEDQISGKTLYVGDPADDIYKWASSFCLELSGRSARRVPRPLLRFAALIGDMISIISKKPFYITSSRYRSMVSEYKAPLEATISLLGQNRRELKDSVHITVEWLRRTQPDFKEKSSALR